MLTRDFAAEETDEGFNVTYSDDPEPIFVAKFRLDPEVAEMIRSRVVPNDAPGHFDGVLANAMPPTPMTQEEQDAVIAEQAAYTQASLANESAPAPVDPFKPFAGNAPPKSDSDLVEPGMTFPAEASTSNPVVNAYMLSTPAQARLPMATPEPSTDTSLSPQEKAMAGRVAEGRAAGAAPAPGEFQSFRTQAMGTPGAAASGSQRSGGGTSTYKRDPGDISDVEFGERAMPRDLEKEARDAESAMLAGIKGEIDRQEADIVLSLSQETAEIQQKMKDDLAKRLHDREVDSKRMFSEIMAGKVDPDRIYANMGTGQRIGTIVGLLLSGIGGAASGRQNPVVSALNQEIDRDIQLQKDAMGRKMTMFQTFLDEGRTEIEAWKLTKAASLDAAAAKMAARAAQLGGDKARLAADANVLALQGEAAKERAAAEESFFNRQLTQFQIVQKAKADRAQADANIEKNQIDAYDARTRRIMATQGGAGGDKTLQVEITPGQWIQAADPTAREKIAAGRDGHDSFIKGLDQLEALRRKNPGGNVLPAWMAFMGFDSAKESKIGDSLAGAVQLAFLKANGAGAYDKGSGALASAIIESPANYFGTNDTAFFGKMAELKSLANADYMATIRGRMAPGQAPALFGSAPMNAKPIGRVP